MSPRILPFASLLLLALPLGCGERGTLGPGGESGSAVATTGALAVAADLDDALGELVDDSGTNLGFAPDQSLTLRWAGSAAALVTDLCSPDGERLDIQDGDPIVLGDGRSTVNGTFSAAWTLEDLAGVVESTLNTMLAAETDTRVDVRDDGTLHFVNPAGGTRSDITVSLSSPQRPVFNSMIQAVLVPEAGEGLSRPTLVMADVVRDEDDATVETLRSGLESAFQRGSPAAEVRYAAGRFLIENPTQSSQDLHGVWFENPSGSLESAIGLWGGSLRRGETFLTPRTLRVRALASEALVDLLDRGGNRTGLAPRDEIALSATVNGQPIDPVSFTISTAGDGSNDDRLVWTVDGLLGEIADVLPLRTDQGAAIEDGRVVLRTEESAWISDVVLTAESAPAFAEVFGFGAE